MVPYGIISDGMQQSAVKDLILVMPVYNEAACIRQQVRSWQVCLDNVGVEYRILVLNDGSEDGTGGEIAIFENDPTVMVINKKNSGHGPTIVRGYEIACQEAEWVFQCDSDGEIEAETFPNVWNQRYGFDAVLGVRTDRSQSVGRRLISAASRLTVRLLFGKGVKDVNVPYRLIRSDVLSEMLGDIPDNAFAPNIIMSGLLVRRGARICNVPVSHHGRSTGEVSIAGWKLWKSAVFSLWQTLKCAVTELNRGQRDASG